MSQDIRFDHIKSLLKEQANYGNPLVVPQCLRGLRYFHLGQAKAIHPRVVCFFNVM